jgi:lysophospholipase L1-like esterase
MAVTVENGVMAGPFFPNGVTTAFAFEFRALAKGDLTVYRGAPDDWDAVDPSLYDVAINAVEGGEVRFTAAPAAGDPLYIAATPTFDQGTEYPGGEAPFTPKSLNAELDRAAMRAAVVKARVDRALVSPIGMTPPRVGDFSDADGMGVGIVDGVMVPIANSSAAVEQNVADSQAAAQAATQQAGIATAQANVASGHSSAAAMKAALSLAQADRAQQKADLAELAADAATVSAPLYADEATGRAAVANGEVFRAVGASSAKSVDVWQRVNSGSSTLLRSYPSLSRFEGAISETVIDYYGDTAPAQNGSSGSGWFGVRDLATRAGKLKAIRLASIGAVTVTSHHYRLTDGTLNKISTFTVEGDGTENQRVAIDPIDWSGTDILVFSAAQVRYTSDGGVTTPGSYYIGETAVSVADTTNSDVHLEVGLEVEVVQDIDFLTRFAELGEFTEQIYSKIGAEEPLSLVNATAGAPWTMSEVVAADGLVDQLYIGAKSTGTMVVERMAGATVVATHNFAVGAASPQVVPAGFPIQAGDKLRFSGIDFGYSDPATPGSAAVDGFLGLGFALGARIVSNGDTKTVKQKLVELSGGLTATALPRKIACWGDSLFAYIQDPANSLPAQLGNRYGVESFNGGVSGETASEIEARFNAAADKHSWVTLIRIGRNSGFATAADRKTTMAVIGRMIAKLHAAGNHRYLILPVWNGDAEYAGGAAAANKVAIDLLNEMIATRWPHAFLDTRRHLVLSGMDEAGLTDTGTDATDRARDVIPASLRLPDDFLHGNTAAYQVETNTVGDAIDYRGWLA